MRDVQGKVALITGGASGIGLGMARAFIGAGMKVMIADIREDHLSQALSSFGDNANVRGMKLDVTDRSAIVRAADETEHAFGKVHVLCNNAGVGAGGPMAMATYADWDWIMGVNLGGVINGIVTFVPRMLAHGEGGHIVNTCSMSGILPHPGAGIYTTSKAAVIGMSEVLRSELAESNIGVSAFCPGPVQTNIAESEKTRPAHLAETGYAEFNRQRPRRLNAALFMDPLEVGERVLKGVRDNKLFIFTHSEFRAGLRERCDAIMAAVPDRPQDPAFMAEVPFLLRNRIYTEGRTE